MDQVMEELMMDDSGKQMIERLAIRAEEGMRSRPVVYLAFKEARTCSHTVVSSLRQEKSCSDIRNRNRGRHRR